MSNMVARGDGTVPVQGPVGGVDIPVPPEMPIPQGPPGIINPGGYAATQGACTDWARDDAQAAFQTGTAGRRTVTGRRSFSAPPAEDRNEGDNPRPGTRRRFDQTMGPTREGNTGTDSGNSGTQAAGANQPEMNGGMRDISMLLETMKQMFLGQEREDKWGTQRRQEMDGG